jgi:hypothetical protein
MCMFVSARDARRGKNANKSNNDAIVLSRRTTDWRSAFIEVFLSFFFDMPFHSDARGLKE